MLLWYLPNWYSVFGAVCCYGTYQVGTVCCYMVLTRLIQCVRTVCCYGTYQAGTVYLVQCVAMVLTRLVQCIWHSVLFAVVLTRLVQCIWCSVLLWYLPDWYSVFGAVCCYGTHQVGTVYLVQCVVCCGTHQTGAVDAEGRLEVGCFMEVVFEAVAEGVTVRADKVRLHLRFTDHPIPVSKNKTMVLLQCLHLRFTDHPVPVSKNKTMVLLQCLHLRLTDHPVPVSKNKTMVLLQCLRLRLTDHPSATVNKIRLILALQQPENL